MLAKTADDADSAKELCVRWNEKFGSYKDHGLSAAGGEENVDSDTYRMKVDRVDVDVSAYARSYGTSVEIDLKM